MQLVRVALSLISNRDDMAKVGIYCTEPIGQRYLNARDISLRQRIFTPIFDLIVEAFIDFIGHLIHFTNRIGVRLALPNWFSQWKGMIPRL